eukprot:5276279-Amphidinium_carterae.1
METAVDTGHPAHCNQHLMLLLLRQHVPSFSLDPLHLSADPAQREDNPSKPTGGSDVVQGRSLGSRLHLSTGLSHAEASKS